MVKSFPKLMTDTKLQIQEGQETKRKRDIKKNIPRHIFKLLKKQKPKENKFVIKINI